MSRTRQSKPNRSRTVASNVAAVVDRAVVAVNSNHAVRKVVRSLVTRSPLKNRTRRLGDAKPAGEQQRRRRPRKPAAAQ